MTITQPRFFFLGLSIVLAACGEGLTLPPDGAAAHIEVKSGDGQQGRAGTKLDSLVVVRVTDTQGRNVADATVNFTVAGGATAGVPLPASAVTDANGEASIEVQLGAQAGPLTGTAEVPVGEGLTPVRVAFTAMTLPANANGIELVSGNEQSGAVNTVLAAPLVVKVTDVGGNPVPSTIIGWSVTGGGSVSGVSTLTDANGQASVTRTLGSTAGPQTAVATADGLAGSPITFTHTATAGNAATVTKESGDNQGGSPGEQLGSPLVVRVLDGAGNPIPDRAVTWLVGTGGGSVTPESSPTDADGKASTSWTLGPSAGSQTVNAVVSGVATVTFTATAAAGGPSASRSRVDLQPDRIPAGGSSTIIVRVRDASNNRLAGVPVSATSSVSGDAISPASATTGEDGVATFSFGSTASGERTITVVAGGVTLDDHRVITVVQRRSTTVITGHAPNPSTQGQQIHVTWTVTGEGGGTPTGTVTVFSLLEAGDAASCTMPVSQGACDITFGVAGSHPLRASYSGDTQFEDSEASATHEVTPPPANQPPVTGGDAYPTPGGGAALDVPAPGVLGNDTDTDGPAALTAAKTSDPTQGTLTLEPNGAFVYTPFVGATGSDSFTYQASDGANTTSETVNISITP